MKLQQLIQVLFLTGSILAMTNAAQGSKIQHFKVINTNAKNSQQQSRLNSTQPLELTRRRHSQVERSIHRTDHLVQSPIPSSPLNQVIEVTSVKANATDNGVEVLLETPRGEQLQVSNRNQGKSFIADIPNAQLRLPNGDRFTFNSEKPTAEITQITVSNFDANTIRVTITGEAGLPTVELFDSDEGLIFGINSATPDTEAQSQETLQVQQPETETEPPQTSVEDEEIEIVVTGSQETGYSVPAATSATRTDTPLRDIPQSIQVVPQQVIEDQQVIRLDEALRNVSGVTFGGDVQSRGEEFTIRGFNNVPILRDGFRRYGSFESFPEVANLDRVEVL